MRRPVAAALLTLVTAAVVLGGVALPAQAHNVLVASTPAAGETLTALPAQFSITTNEPLLDTGGAGNSFALQVRDAAGLFYGDGCVTVIDAAMSTAASLGDAGAYTMLWQAVSADGHTVSGEIPFTWSPTGDVETTAGNAAPAVCGVDASPSATPEPTVTATPEAGAEVPASTAAPAPASAAVPLDDVLWIGGTILAVGLAVAAAIAYASYASYRARRRPPTE